MPEYKLKEAFNVGDSARYHAERTPDKIATIYEDRVTTFAQLDRSKIRQMNLPDVEKRVKDGGLAFGSPREVADRLIEMAERMGANRMLLNLNLGALPHEMFLEQVRRFGREVLPRLQAHQVKKVPVVG